MKNMKKFIIGISMLVLYFVYPYILGYLLPSALKSNTLQLVIRVVLDIIFILVLFMMYKDDLKKEWRIFKKKPFKTILTAVLFLIGGMFVMAIAIQLVTKITNGHTPPSNNSIASLWPKVPFYAAWLTLISAPLIDGMIFRKVFRSLSPNVALFLIISSLVNGFYMIGYTASSINDVLCIIPYALIALAQALCYVKTKTIYAPMIMHFLYNLMMIISLISG